MLGSANLGPLDMKNWYDVITPPRVAQFRSNLEDWCRITLRIYDDMVEIETGSRIPIWRTLFFQTGSSYISAVHWVNPTKFGLLIDFGLLKRATSPNPNPPLSPSRKSIRRHYSAATVARCWCHLANWCRITFRVRWYDLNRNQNYNSNMADVSFSKPEGSSYISQPLIGICRRNLVCRFSLWPFEGNDVTQSKTNCESATSSRTTQTVISP